MPRRTYADHRRELNRRVSAWSAKLLALQAYGGFCECCKEANPVFLTFDHIAKDGADHRASDPSAKLLAQWLVKHGFPDGFRVLCWNCHMAIDRGPRHLQGVCPHQA